MPRDLRHEFEVPKERLCLQAAGNQTTRTARMARPLPFHVPRRLIAALLAVATSSTLEL
jgi:hypothetical protein